MGARMCSGGDLCREMCGAFRGVGLTVSITALTARATRLLLVDRLHENSLRTMVCACVVGQRRNAAYHTVISPPRGCLARWVTVREQDPDCVPRCVCSEDDVLEIAHHTRHSETGSTACPSTPRISG